VTMSTTDRNRALLARQLLVERVRLPLPRAVERMGGIQTQYAPSAYIALWSRVERFERAALTHALYRRSLVQATLLRGTIHIVSRHDYWPWVEAIRKPTRAWYRRVAPNVSMADGRRAGRKLRAALRDGPRTRAELLAVVGKEGWFACGLDVQLVRVPPSGTWERRRADLYALAEDWVGPNTASAAEGVELLARRYLAAFGPARPADIRNWARLDAEDLRRVRCCSSTHERQVCFPTSSGRASSPRNCRSRCTRSCSTVLSPVPGATRTAGSSSSRSDG